MRFSLNRHEIFFSGIVFPFVDVNYERKHYAVQGCNTIIEITTMRHNKCICEVIGNRYHIGFSTLQLLLRRFKDLAFTLEDLLKIERDYK